mmetsp:Transcript_12292/g.45771  ORF Transcript_12292/g.45771 Transcript_12292/m.45771 type:complete len:296 (-) Transcript_12292:558-1445(-)
MYKRCSFTVVAPMHCSSPLARGTFSKFEMSNPPPPPDPLRLPTAPDPTNVCTSSMTKTTSPRCLISSTRPVTRCSSSPRSFAPAMSNPTSRETTFLCARKSGTSPLAMRNANPSAIAVLPTPGSPSKIGLFLDRRAKICTTRSTSVSRPITGSTVPARAFSVRSTQKDASGEFRCFWLWVCLASAVPCCWLFVSVLGPAGEFVWAFLSIPLSLSLSKSSRRRASVRKTVRSTPIDWKNATKVTSSSKEHATAMCSGAMNDIPELCDSASAASKTRFAPKLNGVSRVPPLSTGETA